MNDRETSEFKMRLNGENPDAELQKEAEDLRLSKLNQRVTLISILIPCFFIAIILFLYLDAKKDVTATFNSGSKEIQNLSERFDVRISEMISQNEQRENELKQNMNTLEKTIGDLSKKVSDNTKTVKNLNSSKASKASLASSVKKLNTSFDSLSMDLESLSKELRELNTRANGEMVSINENLSSQIIIIKKIQSDIARMSSAKLDRRELQGELDAFKKTIRKEFDQQYKNTQDELGVIQNKISTFEEGGPSSQAQIQKPEKKIETPESPKADESSEKPAFSQPGAIIEQDIQ